MIQDFNQVYETVIVIRTTYSTDSFMADDLGRIVAEDGYLVAIACAPVANPDQHPDFECMKDTWHQFGSQRIQRELKSKEAE